MQQRTIALWICLFVLGGLTLPAATQPAPLAVPETVGMSAERLARIEPLMQAYADRQQLAGLITLVARHGEVVHFEHYGQRNLEAGAPMQYDTIFRIYSILPTSVRHGYGSS